jgi:hypothetical protein
MATMAVVVATKPGERRRLRIATRRSINSLSIAIPRYHRELLVGKPGKGSLSVMCLTTVPLDWSN